MIQQNQTANLDIFEVEHYVNKYQSMLTQLTRQKDALHELFMEVQTIQQFNRVQQQIKEKFNQNMLQLEDSLKKLVYLSQCYIDKQQQHKNLKLAHENTIAQNSAQIESQKEQIAYLKDKVKSSDQYVDKLTLQLTDLQEKVGNIDNYFEKQKNKLEHLIQKQQISQQKSSDQFLSQLRQSHLNLSNMLNLTKKQKSQQQVIVCELNNQITVLQNKLSNLQGKYQWQIRKKQSLQQELTERLQMINQMQEQINDLRNVFRNPYEQNQHEESEGQIQSVSEQPNGNEQKIQAIQQIKRSITNNLSQQVQDYADQVSQFRGSYIFKSSQVGVKLENPQKYTDEDDQKRRPRNQSGQGLSISMRKISYHSQAQQIQQKNKFYQKQKNGTVIQRQKLDINRQDIQKVPQSQDIEKSPSERFGDNRKSFEQKNNKSKSIGNSRKRRNFMSFAYEQKEEKALENIQTPNTKKGQQNMAPTNRSHLKAKAGNYKKVPIQLDPYFSHYILTSQSVKIRQDIQDLLNIDVKPFYKEILDKRIPMHLWDQWIRNKLREIWKESKENKEKS